MPRHVPWARRASKALLLAALVALPAGCGERRPAETVVITSLSDIEGLNPLLISRSDWNRDVSWLLFPLLLRERADFRQGPPTFEPFLAESWEWSDDNLALTVRLREGAVWSDGVPITAGDVRWTWQAQVDPEVASPVAHHKARIRDVEVLDDHTARFHFDEVYPTRLLDVAEGVVLPRHAWGERPFGEWRSDAGWFQDHLVAGGPFLLAAWRPDEEIVLERNPRYFEPGLPRLEKVVVRVVPDKNAQLNQLLGGGADYVMFVPPDQAARVEASEALAIDAFWGRQYDYLCWNTRHPQLGEAEVRRALTRAVDRQTIIDALYRGRARVSVGPVLSTIWAFNGSIEPWPFDSAAARRALVAQGFADLDGDGVLERGGEPFSLELIVQSGNRVHLGAATMIQEQLSRAGVEIRLRALEFNTFVQRLLERDFEASIGSWSIDTSLDLTYAFHSSEIKEGGYNFGSYANPEADWLIAAAKLEGDLETKRRLLHEVQEILHRDQPYTFLWEPQQLNGRSRRLMGTAPDAISSLHNLREWWIE